jgi:hypothetical protein
MTQNNRIFWLRIWHVGLKGCFLAEEINVENNFRNSDVIDGTISLPLITLR